MSKLRSLRKILKFSDVHLHNYKTFNNRDKSRLDVGLDIVREIYRYANEHGIDVLCFAGDWFNAQGDIPAIVVNRSVSLILEMADKYPHIECYAISGNHDHSSKNLLHKPAVTALEHLQKI